MAKNWKKSFGRKQKMYEEKNEVKKEEQEKKMSGDRKKKERVEKVGIDGM